MLALAVIGWSFAIFFCGIAVSEHILKKRAWDRETGYCKMINELLARRPNKWKQSA